MKFLQAMSLISLVVVSLLIPVEAYSRSRNTAKVDSTFSLQQTQRRLAMLPLHHIEGIWEFPGDGVSFVIERYRDTSRRGAPEGYTMVVASAPNRSLRPGTILGYIDRASRPGEYEAKIYTKAFGAKLSMPKRFTIKVDETDSYLTITAKRSAFSINLWRLLPYLWRYTVYPNRDRENTKNAVRIFPTPQVPLEPIYL